MKRLATFLVLLITYFPFIYIHAAEEAQGFGECITDSMNGKERKLLAKWIFFAMSSHNTVKAYTNITEQDLEQTNRLMGRLFTRLITEDCPNEAKVASDAMGVRQAFFEAFKIAGEAASRELMADPNVGKTLNRFEKFVDNEKIEDVLK